MHSTFSDGEYSPTKLARIAKQHKVSILSLTDHDSFNGMEEFLSATQEAGIMGFPGIEITVKFRDFELHLLGYFKSMDTILPDLDERVGKMKQEREDRMHILIDKINEVVPEPFAGSILFENVEKAAEGVIGRPHLAREMVRLNIVKTTNEAFELYLVPHNIEKDNIDIEAAINLIRKSRGVPVLAHPGERQYSLHNPKKGRDYDDIPGFVGLLRPGASELRAENGYIDVIGVKKDRVGVTLLTETQRENVSDLPRPNLLPTLKKRVSSSSLRSASRELRDDELAIIWSDDFDWLVDRDRFR